MFYYLTVMNENYEHPAMPEGAEGDILKGMYQFRKGKNSNGPRVQLLGSGTIFREAVAAAELLRADWGVESDLWSCPSASPSWRATATTAPAITCCTRTSRQKVCHVTACLGDTRGPVIAATDYIRAFADQIRPFVAEGGRRYVVLGTDGFGRSDTREKLRHFFEVDRYWITLASLRALADDGTIEVAKVAEAIKKYGLNPDKPNPVKV